MDTLTLPGRGCTPEKTRQPEAAHALTRMWNRNYRRWKRGAEAATAPSLFGDARDRLAPAVAEQVLSDLGGRNLPGLDLSPTLLALEVALAPALTEAVLLASLSLEYLDTLEEALSQVDYEDHPALQAEVQWVSVYLSGQLRHVEAARPLLALFEGPAAIGERRAPGLYRLLAGQLAAVLLPRTVAA